jgi:hypothetical protein
MNGAVVLVSAVGAARGSLAAASALACTRSEPDRTALLIDVGAVSARPTLVASAAARELEERLALHLPDCPAASRGQICRLAIADEAGCFDAVRAALPLVRGSLAVVHVPPRLFQAALGGGGVGAGGVLLRADLATDRALTALVARDVRERGLAVRVLKRGLPWLSAHRALFGAWPAGAGGGLPARILQGLALEHACYAGTDDEEADSAGTAQQQRRDHARPRRWRGLHRDAEREAGR